MNIVPKRSAVPALLSHYYKALKEIEIWDEQDPHRLLSVRCSAIPFCPLGFFVSVATKGMKRSLDMSGLFYTSVGTAVHTVMQKALALDGRRLFGNWKCRQCKKIEKFSLQRKCCSKFMDYEEIDIDWKGVKGHVDTLFALDIKKAKEVSKLCQKKRIEKAKGLKFAVIDYKTTSETAKKTKARNPGQTYKEQAMAYAYLLGKQYDLKILEVILFFIPRDNPRNPTTYQEYVTPSSLEKIKSKIKIYKRAHKEVLNLSSLKEVKQLYEDYGKCSNPYCKTCKSKSIVTELKQAFKIARSEERLPLREFILSY